MVTPDYWALVPAAGVGARMGAARPKQYLELCGRTVIEHTLLCLLRHSRIKGVVVVVAADDDLWPTVALRDVKLLGSATGGADRAASVMSGLQFLRAYARNTDWILVHDAVRPCLRGEDIDALIDGVGNYPDGGLLGAAITDTVKRTDEMGYVERTVTRENLYRALTPQMFSLDALCAALDAAVVAGVDVTDEATAMEHVGVQPLVVPGHSDNIKITVPADLAIAELYLARQQETDN